MNDKETISIFQNVNFDKIAHLTQELEDELEQINIILQKKFGRRDMYAESTSLAGVYIVFKDSYTPVSLFESMITKPNFDPYDLTRI